MCGERYEFLRVDMVNMFFEREGERGRGICSFVLICLTCVSKEGREVFVPWAISSWRKSSASMNIALSTERDLLTSQRQWETEQQRQELAVLGVCAEWHTDIPQFVCACVRM